MTTTNTRRLHLRDTKTGNATCAGRRTGYGREYIVAKYSEFAVSPTEARCEKCASGKLFAFLEQQTAKALIGAAV